MRLNSEDIWFKYSSKKQTYQELAEEFGCSVRTIQRHIQKARKAEPKPLPAVVNIIMDTTHFKRRFAVLILMDSLSKQPVYSRFIPAEKNIYYVEAIDELIKKGIKIQSITCDGRRGLLNAYPQIPTQMCHFHQIGRAIFYLTKKPKSEAGQALLKLSYHLKSHTKETFGEALKQWLKAYSEFFNERSDVNPKRFKHRTLRSAYWSLKRNMEYLFIYQEYATLNIPRTTNRLESFFKEMKSKLSAHAGLSDNNKMMFLKDFIHRHC